MSSFEGLAFVVVAAVAIGCGARPLDPGDDAGRVGVGVDGGAGPEDARNAGPDLRDAVAIDISIGPELCGNPPRLCIEKPCGDGQLEPFEMCDDGNNTSGDGCSAICQIPTGWRCPAVGRPCVPICGDGLVTGPEECDDGNTDADDGCSRICLTEPTTARCGDGLVSGAEECDDGTFNSDTTYGGCTTDCRFGPFCGDGMRNGLEECDYGRNDAYYGVHGGCTPRCGFSHFCGDGVVDEPEGELCDLGPGNGIDGQPCNVACRILIE
jgi:cysteine-rich repeat protein